jgi:hypothetical protein
MMLNLGSGERHRATNIDDLQPRTVETLRRQTLRQNTHRALLHYLWDKLVRIEQRPTDGNEKDALSNTPRIVTYIRDDPRFITAEFRARYFCYSFRVNHGFEVDGFTTTAGMF